MRLTSLIEKKFYRLIAFVSILSILGLVLSTVFAAGELGLGLTALDTQGNPVSTVSSGEIIEYVIDYSCADLTDGCGDLTITFDLDLALVELVDVVTSPSYNDTYASPTVTIINNPATNPTFDGGESAQARVRVRVLDGLTGSETIPASVTGTIDRGAPNPVTTTVSSSAATLTVTAPTEQWSIVKTQTAPSGGVAPAPGGRATYDLAFCPDDTTGNISITDPILVDNFPAGAIVFDSGGGVVDTINNTITWQPPTLDNPLRPSDGCETVTYTLEFPTTDFSVGDAFANSATGDGSNPEIGATGVCDDGCTDNVINETVDPPTADFGVGVTKNGPGSTVIVAPGNSSGTSVFTWGLDLGASNVQVEAGAILTDILPVASDTFPATSITNISSGEWGLAPDGSTITASLEITTTSTPAWTALMPVLTGANQSSSSAGGDFPGPGNGGAGNNTTDLVTGVRLVFSSPLPAGFSFTTAPSLRYIVRDGMPADDYDDPITGNPVSYQNCLDATGSYVDQNGVTQNTNGQNCTDFLTSDNPAGFANITTSKSSNTNEISPLDEIEFTIDVDLTQEASGDLINPAIEDILPAGLEFVSFSYSLPGALAGDTQNEPYLLVSTVAGRERLLFYWDSAAPVAGSVTSAGATAAGANPLTLTPPATGNRTISIVVTARALISAAAGPYTNTYSIASESPNMRCQGAGSFNDDDDIDGDGLGTDVLCQASDDYSVREAAEMSSQKWIRSTDGVVEGGTTTFDFFQFNNLDTPSTACPILSYDTASSAGPVDFTRYPCVAEGLPTENFEYLMRATNTGIVDIDQYIQYDVIPHIGDIGVSELVEGQIRDTEFAVFLTGPVVVESVTQSGFGGRVFTAATFTVEYNTSVNACRGEVANPPAVSTSYPAGCDNNWQPAGVHAWADVRSFRIVQDAGGIIPAGGGELIFTVPMQINEYDPVAPANPNDGAQTGEIAWNSFAQQFHNALSGAELLAAEPPKVGITVAQRYSVGNRVWIDNGGTTGTANNGIRDGDEVGINGVTVQLWRDIGDGSGFVLFATDVTRSDTGAGGGDGYYFFGNLDGGPNIDYQVRIPGTEFDPANGTSDLDYYIGSTGQQNAGANNNTDNRDTGNNPTLTDVLDDYINNGVSSQTFNLTSNSEATGETDVNDDNTTPDGNPPTNEGPLGYGENNEQDVDSDLTVDFGFYKPMSLGNRVWLDDGNDGAGGTIMAQRNDGIINGGEVGIENVVVGLYASDGTTAIDNPFIAGNQAYQVTTDADGYYLFQGLIPGDYVVRIMPANFQFGATPADPDGPLASYISSNASASGDTRATNPVDENGFEYGVSATDSSDDRTDHGIDPAVDGQQRTNGIYSDVISLTADLETTSELPADKNVDGDGLRVEVNNSDLTVDFGFFQEVDTNFSLGNFVWNDINNDGIYDPDGLDDNLATLIDNETGIQGVQMALFTVDAGGNPSTPVPDPSNTAIPYVVSTDVDGYYVFSELDPGRYIVQMTGANFNGGVLTEYISSTGHAGDTETDSDVNENGIDPTDGNANNSVLDEYQANGVYSTPILLEPEGEPVNEPSNQANPGAGSGNSDDDNSDLTVDFGVYRPMSIGNIVWLDNGSTAAGVNINQYNDGIRNGNEAGIANVTVQLFGDFDGDGAEDATPRTTTTDANGYYLFDGLTRGNYRVEIPSSNFAGGNLANLVSSFDATAPVDADLDDDDHGIDVADPTANAVVSPTINLEYDSEPLETDTVAAGGDPDDSNNALDGPDFRGNNGETDDNSDRTVDFGFVAPPMAIGNRVWIDDGNNGANPTLFNDGIVNGGEAGQNGVTVNLYDAADTATVIATTTTINDGYYLFDNLPPGNYVVGIPASNFDADGADNIPGNADDGVLAEYVSSTDFATPVDADADNDDHGINPATVGNEVFSPTIVLTTNGETQVDDPAVTTDGTNGETDNNSDLTVDFGFVRPMSLGNRVWLDTDRATGTLGDGTRQASETGIGNVTVELYLDNDGSGTLTAGDTLVARTTTTNTGTPAQDGYYLFDETTTVTAAGADDPLNPPIGPGNYIVHIPASNFATSAPLEGFINSDGANGAGTDTGTDSEGAGGDENGVNATVGTPATYPITAGVSSTQIQLRYDNEPLAANETDRDPNRTAVNGVNVADDNSDLTIDFGFYNALSIGNRVWYDNDRNGFIDGTDDNPNAAGANPGIDGVTVYLYRDDTGGAGGTPDGIPDGAPIATDITANGGYYLFDQTGDQSIFNGGLLLTPGNYIVGIDPTAGNNPTILDGHVNTITRVDGAGTVNGTALDAPADSDDNGIDRRDVNPDPTVIYSESIALASLTETETETDKEAGVGDGRYNIRDNSSNLTIDFGFFEPLSIGNRVWLDDGVGTSNNGLIDAGEVGIDGVIVELFRDTGAGINPATDTPYRTTVTNSDTTTGALGYYLFDDLPEGDYVVRLSPRNFIADDGNPANGVEGALLTADGPYSSSESGSAPQSTYLVDNQTDNNDNGNDTATPQTVGIVSNTITLSYGAEPDGAADADLDTDVGEGTFGERDNNAEMTVDFGVYPPAMSIGNRVFYDYDNNRMLDGADVGVNGVVVNLFRDTNNDGLPDSGINSPIATTTTDADGYYIFDNLQSGRYLVQIDESNFVANAVLDNFYSSQDKDGANNPVAPSDNEDDTIENGIDNNNLGNNPDPQVRGVFSQSILLEPSGESTTEDLGPEGNGEPDIEASNSELTIDFGFYQPMSLGNVVWFDTNADGLFNNGEAGIPNVQVYLYRETVDATFNGNETPVQVFDGTGYVNFDTTDANGFYLFDNLPPGQYWVQIDSGNFTASGDPLFNHVSTQPENVVNTAIAPAPDSDSNDNGTPNDATATAVGVTSELVTLGVIDPVNGSGLYIPNSVEPINEINKSNNPPTPVATYDGPASIGRYGELDANSDITIDFGFVLADMASMSIGNRVWLDSDRSGLIESANANGDDEASAGIDGVAVLLYRANAAGNPVGAPIARDVTANGGYYLFDVLDTNAATATGDGDGLGGPVTPGSYVVSVAPSNFTAGNVLEGYTNTVTGTPNTGVAPSTAVVENPYAATPEDNDNNDNGTVDATYGVLSNLVTLTLQGERDDEEAINKEVGVLDGTDSGGVAITANNSDLTIDFGFYVPASIGNRVWIDSNNNGVFDTGELPVPDGVTLTLYRDTDSSGDYTTGTDLAVDVPGSPGTPYQVTTSNGYYLFENLFPFDDYIVVLDPANFSGGALNSYIGSNNSASFEDDTDTDLNDNGRDAASYDPTVDGIPSGIIEITAGGEPTSEQGSGNAADGPNSRGNNGEADANSNLTVDFGVFPSTYYSIGNRVWLDTGAGANANNGVHDSDETGIPDVVVNLYRDDNSDGIPDSLTVVDTQTTDANGYYLFDSLPEGNYIVSIAPQNFNSVGVLLGYSTTSLADASDNTANDDDDNVSDHQNTVIDPDFGIYSNTYNLSPAPLEPVSEADPTPAGAAQPAGVDPFGNAIPDEQSNLTVDFGFVQTMTLGNVVWFDLNNNGLKDVGETGIAGVDIVLYQDDGDGTFDPALDTTVATDTTDGNGYYLFNDVLPGDYFIHIPNSNWTAGATPLVGMQSSGTDAPALDVVDSNDNGTPNTAAPADGVTSGLIPMVLNNAPTGESDLSRNSNDGRFFRGVNNPSDNNSDLTRDFGFYLGTPMSIGNRVWLDDGAGANANNGLIDSDEDGIANVVVELFADVNGDAYPDTTLPIRSMATDADGYYLFDGLPPGQYVVVLSPANWVAGGLLDGYLSTSDGTPDNDSEDNGIDNPTPRSRGIRSGTIVLTVGTEPSPTAATDDDEAVTGTGSNGETDDNSNLTVDFGLVVSYDWGDAPDSYGTTDAATGANHRITSGLYLGASVDDEADGQAVGAGADNNGANGDGTDEDGITPPTFVAGTTVDVDVTVVNDTGQPANLIAWFDWDGNGVFDDTEAVTATVPDGTNGVIQLSVDVPLTAENLTGGETYARLRLTNDPLTTSEATGRKNSGEVEDYRVEILPAGLLINKTDGQNSIVAGQFNTYTIVIENSGAPRTGIRFLDEIPLPTAANATGYDPDTITWTCVATGGASCIATQPAGTGSSGGPFAANALSASIDESIDLPTGGRVVYTLTGRMNAQAGLIPVGGSGPVVNTAQLPNEVPVLENSDSSDVIFDPPFGVKTGTVTGDTIIRWTMVWYNPGATQAGVTIGDTVVPPQQLPATPAEIDLQCSGGGAGGANTGTCTIIGNRVEWTGDMDTSSIGSDAAAVRISFNVTIPGPGTYNNTGVLNAPGFPSVASSAAVTIADPAVPATPTPPEQQDNNNGNNVSGDIFDPTIVKLVNPLLALPGEDVVWTIVVSNPNANNQLDNVSVTENMPAEFDILSVATNIGTFTRNGQTVNWQIGSLAPLQEVSIVIVTQLNPNFVITDPLIINRATVNMNANPEGEATAEVSVIGELPDTGETPWWHTVLMIVGVVAGTVVILYSRYVLRRR